MASADPRKMRRPRTSPPKAKFTLGAEAKVPSGASPKLAPGREAKRMKLLSKPGGKR